MAPRSGNVKVQCPHCKSEVWTRNLHNDACPKCGHTIPAPMIE
jgi:ribosomal protein S27E